MKGIAWPRIIYAIGSRAGEQRRDFLHGPPEATEGKRGVGFRPVRLAEAEGVGFKTGAAGPRGRGAGRLPRPLHLSQLRPGLRSTPLFTPS